MGDMRVSAKADYAVRAVLELAASADEHPLKRDQISAAQNIPSKFLETILLELKHAGVVKSTRGAGGRLRARPTGKRRSASPTSSAPSMGRWRRSAASASRRSNMSARHSRCSTCGWPSGPACARVLEATSLQDVADGELPDHVRELTAEPEAWISLNRRRRTPAEVGEPEE